MYLRTMEQTRILIVDDEPIVAEVLEKYLRREGFEVAIARDGEAAVAAALADKPDLVLLDLMLPRLDGLEVFRRIRAQQPVPVIMLTAKGEETDRVVGLEMGADDYVAKPFSPREIVARARAVLRRTGRADANGRGAGTLTIGDVAINPHTRRVEIGGRSVDLTPKEFDLLWFLANHQGQVFTRSQLLDQVWDYQYFGDASTVTVHIRRLRSKIETDAVRPRYLKTVWGVGYKLEA
jgi:DNA-binding response OmpR family regulator